ncbi:unnamed protein product, partial [marine sediment metagenome]
MGTLANNIDKILIGTLLGAPELAIYAIALAIPTKIKDLLKLVWAPYTPKFSQDRVGIKQVQEKLKRLVLPVSLAIIGGSVLYWLFIDDIMFLLFGTGYVAAGAYSKLLLLMILASIPAAFLGTFTMAQKKTKAIILGYHIFPFLKLGVMSG